MANAWGIDSLPLRTAHTFLLERIGITLKLFLLAVVMFMVVKALVKMYRGLERFVVL